MCGIAGILLDPAASPGRLDAIAAMTATLHHRGPDGDGLWMDRAAGIALGHRRLSIVDLSEAGHQPMLADGSGLVLTYNGEVYDFGGMKEEIEASGHRFRGHSDTEVMLAAFQKAGVEASLKRLSGMFAFALWDRAARTLCLARDALGKKPLYVALAGGSIVFASELRAIRAFPGFQAKVDAQALALMLRYGWVPDDHCIYENVFKLPPGTMLTLRAADLATSSAAGLRAQARPWWSLADVATAGQRSGAAPDASVLESELDGLLRRVVRERMVADVPLGAFLSGGIDSAMIVALMQAQASRPVRTFTVGFGEARYDETEDAAGIARYLGTDHTEFRVTPADARAVIPDLPRIWDEPFADESQIPTLLVSQLARRHVTVALSGDGGDECFGGYVRHVLSSRLDQVFRIPAGLRAGAAGALDWLGPDAWDGLLRTMRVPAGLRRSVGGERLQKLVRVLGAKNESELYQRLITVGQGSMEVPPGARGMAATPPLASTPDQFMYRDMAGYLPGNVLVKLDRASMAAGLEARCPFLDRRVVAFAWRVPATLKIRDGKGKWLLRQVLRRYLPESLFERPKHGFDVPIGAWLRGPLRGWAEDLLDEGRLREQGLLDPVRVRARWDAHLSGQSDRGCELWAVLMAQAWLGATREQDRAGLADMSGPMAMPVAEGATLRHAYNG